MSKGDEHRLARQNVIFFISESRNYQVGTKIGPQKCPLMFFLIVGYQYSLGKIVCGLSLAMHILVEPSKYRTESFTEIFLVKHTGKKIP